jgi:2-dehydro-3-deoxygalactonokinase
MCANMTSDAASATPALIALDWGTSSLRAFLMDARGDIIDQRSSPHGIQNLPEPGVPGFERAFALACSEWLARSPGLPVVAGGMVGSAQGWREAPYVKCPADTHVLASQAAVVDAQGGVRILLAPGVLYDPPDAAPDVIRGEEIQIAGALSARPDWARRALVVLPGTHSKWVEVEDGRITRFFTYMTGELFAVMRKHSILGRLMPDAKPADEAARTGFAAGLATARKSRPGDLVHQLFSARTLGLTHRLPAEALQDYLSGLLIGHELVSALSRLAAALDSDAPLLLIGDAALCAHYTSALSAFGVKPAEPIGNTAPRGLFEFARAAHLIAKDTPHG